MRRRRRSRTPCSSLTHLCESGDKRRVLNALSIKSYPPTRLVRPLLAAISEQHVAIVTFLLNAGAQPDLTQPGMSAPLITAVGVNNLRIIRMLLEAGANPDVADNDGATPLMHAARLGWSALAKLLLEHSCDVNKVNRLGCTALHSAALNGNVSVVRVLLSDARTNAAITSKRGHTALSCAARCPGKNRKAQLERLINERLNVHKAMFLTTLALRDVRTAQHAGCAPDGSSESPLVRFLGNQLFDINLLAKTFELVDGCTHTIDFSLRSMSSES